MTLCKARWGAQKKEITYLVHEDLTVKVKTESHLKKNEKLTLDKIKSYLQERKKKNDLRKTLQARKGFF